MRELGNGGKPEPFGWTSTGYRDLRGLTLPERCTLRGVRLKESDLSAAKFSGAWLEGGEFARVLFDKADLRELSDHGNSFQDCSFAKTDFQRAAIGHSGSQYRACIFDKANFRGAVFTRAEFNECQFLGCRLKGVDFNASSFVNCSFNGVVEDVWFRGGFPLTSDTEQFGVPRPNNMNNVSFAAAVLRDLTFSDHCDLSTIRLPADGECRLYPDWPERLARLHEMTRDWIEPDRKEADIFITATDRKDQDWHLLVWSDVERHFGADLGRRLLRCLDTLD